MFESIVDSAVHMTRIRISELPFAIDESYVIQLNHDYPIDSTKHHMNDAFVLNRKV